MCREVGWRRPLKRVLAGTWEPGISEAHTPCWLFVSVASAAPQLRPGCAPRTSDEHRPVDKDFSPGTLYRRAQGAFWDREGQT